MEDEELKEDSISEDVPPSPEPVEDKEAPTEEVAEPIGAAA